MRIPVKQHAHGLIAASLAVAVALPVPAFADVSSPLATTVAKGRQLFLHETFSGRGETCSSCHTGAGLGPTVLPGGRSKGPSLANAAAVFPRYKPREQRVVTLEDQIRACVAGALGGTPPAYDSEHMRALVSYLTSLAQGKRLDMGGPYQ
jgi:thiosulfate dehydrogenase